MLAPWNESAEEFLCNAINTLNYLLGAAEMAESIASVQTIEIAS